MANWIMAYVDTPDKPEIRAVAKKLSVPKLLIFGCCLRLWMYADAQTTDGFIPLLDADEIDEIVDLKGFAAALVSVGWLTIDDRGVTIPKFEDKHSQGAKNRELASKRKRNQRIRSDGDSSDKPCHANVTPDRDTPVTPERDHSTGEDITVHSSSPTPSSPPEEEEVDSVDEDWRPAFDAIVDAGVTYPMPCMKGAQKQGHTPQSVIDVCRVYLTHEWEIGPPGHLKTRLTEVPARVKPHENWRKRLTLPRAPAEKQPVVQEADYFAEGRKRQIPESEIRRRWEARIAKQGGTAA